MRLPNSNSIPLLAFIILFTGCRSYHITTQSLLEQLSVSKKENVKFIQGFPVVFPGEISGNSLQEIVVLDKKDRTHILFVTNHTGVRITKNNGKKDRFYFDTLLIKDSLITGKHDHLVGIQIKPINLNDIKKIEIQN